MPRRRSATPGTCCASRPTCPSPSGTRDGPRPLSHSGKPFMGSTASQDSHRRDHPVHADAGRRSARRPGAAAAAPLQLNPTDTWRGRMLGVLRAPPRPGKGAVMRRSRCSARTADRLALGALSQGTAELVRRGAHPAPQAGRTRAVRHYAMPFDMRAMVPRFGDPVSAYGPVGVRPARPPFRAARLGYGGLTSSKVDDAQAGAEPRITWPATCRRTSSSTRRAGWRTAGRQGSPSSVVRQRRSSGRSRCAGDACAVSGTHGRCATGSFSWFAAAALVPAFASRRVHSRRRFRPCSVARFSGCPCRRPSAARP